MRVTEKIAASTIINGSDEFIHGEQPVATFFHDMKLLRIGQNSEMVGLRLELIVALMEFPFLQCDAGVVETV